MHFSKQDEYPVLNGSFKIVASGTTLFVSNARDGLNHQGDEEKDISIELWLSITSIMINSFQSRPAVTDSAANSLRLLKAKVESETLTQVGQAQVQLLRQISEGSYGTAHVAQVVVAGYGRSAAEADTRLAVVKYMAAGAEEAEREDFVKEVQLLSGLEDENISRVLGIGTMGAPHFVVMEYLDHGDLTTFLQSHLPEDTPYLAGTSTKTLSLPSLVYMATQVASGMKYLESLNFVHRDLATR